MVPHLRDRILTPESLQTSRNQVAPSRTCLMLSRTYNTALPEGLVNTLSYCVDMSTSLAKGKREEEMGASLGTEPQVQQMH